MTDDANEMDDALRARTARRCAAKPEFLGYWLELYREREGLEPHSLARHLGCSTETLDDLFLCLRPAPERFAAATARLSERFGVDRKRLAAVILQAEAYARADPSSEPAAGAEPAASWSAAFAAARDRDALAAPADAAAEPEDEDVS